VGHDDVEAKGSLFRRAPAAALEPWLRPLPGANPADPDVAKLAQSLKGKATDLLALVRAVDATVSERVRDGAAGSDAAGDASIEKALRYMGLTPGTALLGHPIDVVFIGSCTNSRLSDLRLAASVFKGRHVAQNVRALVVPGSQQVKRQAEAEGLDRIFREAGADWREAGCSMCLGMNADKLQAGQYSVSTSNRNFEGRQGAGGRTFLASPLTAAASAVAGRIADAREYLA